ncbi:hypothetical protein QL285_040380 [Trifolium repens]|nr:hypothetical protein QL285_040380 [Trifolium repens]
MQEQQPQHRKRPLLVDRDTLLVKPSAMASDQEPQSFLSDLNDDELHENIRRKKNTLNTVGRHLPDQGAKLRDIIGHYEEEFHRRKLNRPPKFSVVQPKVDEEQMEMPDQAHAVGDDAKPNKERVVLETKHDPATNPVHKASSDTVQPMSIPAQLADLRTHIDELFQNLRQHVDMRFQHMELRLLALEISLQLIPKP